jgi:hypothetical protein
MARHPAWFARLDVITETLGSFSPATEWLGRAEMQALFAVSARDAIRLLHQFGAVEKSNSLALPRSSLLAQLAAIRAGSTYAAFRRQREDVAKHLTAARAETAARQFRVRSPAPAEPRARLEDLPASIRWQRGPAASTGRFEIRYDDGADLLWQLAEFLAAVGGNRTQFLAATEPAPVSPAGAAISSSGAAGPPPAEPAA